MRATSIPAKEYETFIDQWSPLAPPIAAGAVTAAAAVRARTEVMDVYRRFPVLPVVLLPPEWPRRGARGLFVQVCDGLLRPGQDHVRAVVASVADGHCPAIQAPTVADMAAGIRQAAD
ncbi:PaaX family transcriptional regulator C-terminal domain-containing protein [Nonomuraea aurantiaca]|uniref:PaaX family transcriptional regulator C-terminal domain-containing protein n=1 Tax=Nonomuraea aurantiaca TaxID=2878562 RepID=UPI001CD9D63E|nr:hypothetical protein [Nonomuraea aurantiaca]